MEIERKAATAMENPYANVAQNISLNDDFELQSGAISDSDAFSILDEEWPQILPRAREIYEVLTHLLPHNWMFPKVMLSETLYVLL